MGTVTKPAAPSLGAANASGGIQLIWSTPSDGGKPISGYKIYRGTSSNTEILYRTVGVTNGSLDAAVTANTHYYYKVTAVNSVGEGPNSNEADVITRRGWYVATTGNDNNAGTLAAPFATINKAGSVVNPGETIYVREGTYRAVVQLTRSGTADEPVTVKHYQAEQAIVDGGGLLPGEGLFNIMPGVHHVVIDGLIVQNSTKYGLENSGHHNTVKNCTIRGHVRAGLLTSDRASTVECDHNVYDNNEITNNVRQNVNDAMGAGGWDSAINSYHGGGGAFGHNTFTNNRVHDNWGEGTTSADYDTFRANQFWDNWSVNIYVDGAVGVVVERNLSYAKEGTPYIAAGRRSIGIGFADEQSPARLDSCVVRNNIILNCSTGINFWNANVSGSGLHDCKFFNNTVVNTVGTGVGFDSGTHTGAELRNNIIWPRAGGALSSAGVTASTNIVKGANTDPGLAGEGSATNFDPNNYKIGSSSSAHNAGTSVAVTDDYFGTTRAGHGTIDIGAHEL